MRRRSAFMLIALVLAALLLNCGEGAAQITETLSSFYVVNNSGQTVDGFRLRMDGVSPSELDDLWTGDYPNVSVVDTGVGCEITWSGATTAAGATARLGWKAAGNANATGGSISWLSGIEPQGEPYFVPQSWNWIDPIKYPLARVGDKPKNNNTKPVWVGRKIKKLPLPGGLPDLIQPGAIWDTGTPIDEVPILVPPGGELEYYYDVEPGDRSFVMMYQVWSDNNGQPGDLEITYLNAANIPEPGGLWALGSGLIGLAGFVIRRRG